MSDDKLTKMSAAIDGGLTEAEKLEIEKEAKAEFQKELKAQAKKEFKEAAKRRIKAEAMFSSGKDDSGDELDTVHLELASYPKYIILDGAVYHSGVTYTKKRAVISVLKDQMDRGWRQEAARMGDKVENTMQRRKVLGRLGLQTH